MPIKPMQRPSRLRKLVIGGLAATALLGAGCKAPQKIYYKKAVPRKPAVELARVERRGSEKELKNRERVEPISPIDGYLEEVAAGLLLNPEYFYRAYSNYSPFYKRQVLKNVEFACKVEKIPNKATALKVLKKYKKYPDIYKVMLQVFKERGLLK